MWELVGAWAVYVIGAGIVVLAGMWIQRKQK